MQQDNTNMVSDDENLLWLTNPDEEPLIDGMDNLSDDDDLQLDISTKRDTFWNRRSKFGLIEVFLVIYFVALVITMPVTEQYLYVRLGHQPLNHSLTSSTTEEANSTNFTLDDRIVCDRSRSFDEDETQRLASRWMLYIGLTLTIPAIFSTFIIGSYSDAIGRKPGLVLPSIGSLLRCILLMAVIKWELPLSLLIVGSFLDGCFGFAGTALSAVFSYVADITTPGIQRTRRIVLVEVALGINAALTSLWVGYFIKGAGYFYPILVALALIALNIAYTLIFIPESLKVKSEWKITNCKTMLKSLDVYTRKSPDGRRWKLLVCLLVFFFVDPSLSIKRIIETLYELRSPFCWNSVKIGVFGAVGTSLQLLVILISTRLLHKYMGNITLAILGSVSGLAGLVWEAFATTDVQLYLAPVIGVLSMVVIPMLRAFMSECVNVDEQGSMFAGIGCMIQITNAVDLVVFNAIYMSTVSFMPGFVFLIMAAYFLASFVLLAILRNRINREDTSTRSSMESIY